MATTIQVKDNTLERLQYFKEYSKESYDEIINKLLNSVEEGELTEETVKGIARGAADIRNKRTKSIEEVAKKFGVKF